MKQACRGVGILLKLISVVVKKTRRDVTESRDRRWSSSGNWLERVPGEISWQAPKVESREELGLRPGARPKATEQKRGVQNIEAWVGRRSRKDKTRALGSGNDGPSVRPA